MPKFEFRTVEGKICCRGDNPEALCDKCKSQVRFATEPPDPYASLRANSTARKPDDDKAYKPFGHPPDGYKLELAEREKRAAKLEIRVLTTSDGVPDGYATALAAGRTR
jgi:hypothetical protein